MRVLNGVFIKRGALVQDFWDKIVRSIVRKLVVVQAPSFSVVATIMSFFKDYE